MFDIAYCDSYVTQAHVLLYENCNVTQCIVM